MTVRYITHPAFKSIVAARTFFLFMLMHTAFDFDIEDDTYALGGKAL
jgi:hypothetical protein